MKEGYVLYVLRVSKLRSIKIGITSFDRKDNRFKEITKAFGKIDFNRSFYYTSTSMKDIKNIEKALHLLLWRDSKELNSKASGHTEFFKEKRLSYVKAFLKKLDNTSIKNFNGPYQLNGSSKSKISFFLLLIFTSLGITGIYFFDFIESALRVLSYSIR